jgi:hypothetical protein
MGVSVTQRVTPLLQCMCNFITAQLIDPHQHRQGDFFDVSTPLITRFVRRMAS